MKSGLANENMDYHFSVQTMSRKVAVGQVSHLLNTSELMKCKMHLVKLPRRNVKLEYLSYCGLCFSHDYDHYV